jgi:hypothetical protein
MSNPPVTIYGVAGIRRDPSNPAHSNLDVVDEFDRATYDLHRQSCAAILNLNEQEEYILIERNYQHLMSTVKYYDTIVTIPDVRRQLNRRSAASHLASDILNWLTATRFYVDHMTKRFSATFGKDSDEFKKLNDELSREYDNSLAYRVTYHFRNFVQHVGFPVDGLRESLDHADGSRALRAYLRRDRLLASYEWNAQVRADLETLPMEIDVIDLISTAQLCFRRIQAVVLTCLGAKAQSAAPSVQDLAAKVPQESGDPYLVALSGIEQNSASGIESMSVDTVPGGVAEWLADPSNLDNAISRLESGERLIMEESDVSPSAPLTDIDDSSLKQLRTGSDLLLGYYEDGGLGKRFEGAVIKSIEESAGDVGPTIQGLAFTASVALSMTAGALQTSAKSVLESILRLTRS